MDVVETVSADVLVIGGGGAGLSAARTALEAGARTVVVSLSRGATPFVSSMNVPLGVADPRDNPEVYFWDMIGAGRGLNHPGLTWLLAAGARSAMESLEATGVEFARDERGRYRQRHLSGSRYPRSVYVRDVTGREVVGRLVRRVADLGAVQLEGVRIIALVCLEGRVVGAVGVRRRDRAVVGIQARATVLAAGGIGHLFVDTTYPPDVAGDAYGLALRAGARLVDMEFVQFEPTVCFCPHDLRGLEMPTAMFGEGAVLRNARGERFLLRENSEGERGLDKAFIARAIWRELEEGRGTARGGVYFDATVLAPSVLESYPYHVQRLRKAGLDPSKDMIEVRPAAHSQLGGIVIDTECATEVPGLFAVGEAAGGVHGASRLAGNSGTEIVVLGGMAGAAAASSALGLTVAISGRQWEEAARQAIDELLREASALGSDPSAVVQRARSLLSSAAGLMRHGESLKAALNGLDAVLDRPGPANGVDLWGAADAVHAVLVGQAILQGALLREESRGAHNRLDFPSPAGSGWYHTYSARDEDGAVRTWRGPWEANPLSGV